MGVRYLDLELYRPQYLSSGAGLIFLIQLVNVLGIKYVDAEPVTEFLAWSCKKAYMQKC